ncbi:MAG TPA: hypothetical protein VNT77_10915 [Allosphingosinicella sp.]|nr:hypothetical protein [Allosphingosinicella sp.]
MSNPQHAFAESALVDAGRHYARLRHVLGLVERIAGRSNGDETTLDESARVSGAYGHASPVTQRRFDTMAAEVSGWSAAGMDALACAQDPHRPPSAAAAVLADELDRALVQMARLLRL